MPSSRIKHKLLLTAMICLVTACAASSKDGNRKTSSDKSESKYAWLLTNNIDSSQVCFFEIGSNTGMPQSKRFYSNTFKFEKTRYIFADLNFKIKSTRSGFAKAYIRSKWKRNGKIFKDSMYNPSVPCSNSLYVWYGFGDSDPGAWWDKGHYEIEFYDFENNLLTKGSFSVE